MDMPSYATWLIETTIYLVPPEMYKLIRNNGIVMSAVISSAISCALLALKNVMNSSSLVNMGTSCSSSGSGTAPGLKMTCNKTSPKAKHALNSQEMTIYC